ncbi:MAG: isoaspartyl peptidase [Cyanobacteria bacterium J055]|nr:MAG: isoaspartyl peptidase [Cyanobacteria bacterium J055]
MMSQPIQPKLIIHGGAGSSLSGKGSVEIVRQSLHRVIEDVYELLQNGASAPDAVVRGCQLLEDDPLFNAGTGSVLQSDGQIRMSASLMDGTSLRFSGVINVSRVQNPIDLAKKLQPEQDRVLSDFGATEFAREIGVPIYDPKTEKRLKEWWYEHTDNFHRKMADVVAEPAGRGTIGVVALDAEGRIAAGTSTGGKGFERIGRVSDSAMPAGNYANDRSGVSCTGIGEDIIEECLAAKIVVRVTDGMSLVQAMERSFAEAESHNRDFGAISLDATGSIVWGKTSDVILAAFHNGDRIGDSLEAEKGTKVVRC